MIKEKNCKMEANMKIFYSLRSEKCSNNSDRMRSTENRNRRSKFIKKTDCEEILPSRLRVNLGQNKITRAVYGEII